MNVDDKVKLAKAFMVANKYNKAELILQQCLSLNAECVSAIDLLISIYRRQGKLCDAVLLKKKLDLMVARLPGDQDVALANTASALTRSGLIPAPFRFVRDPLAMWQVEELLRMAEQNPDQFEQGKVSGRQKVVLDRRNSLRLVAQEASGTIAALLYPAVVAEFELCCENFSIPVFEISNVEYKYCHYPHGSYFRLHRDNRRNYKNEDNDEEMFERRISFVYYFHRTPKQFSGGELLLHDTDREKDQYSFESYLRVIPENNTLIFFHSGFYHQVTDVVETSGDVLNGRFCINGHICATVPADSSQDALSAAELSESYSLFANSIEGRSG